MSLHVINVEQGSPEWHDARRGIVTASVVGQLVTPSTIKPASNDRSRALVPLLASERITGWTEEHYTSREMERGHMDEPLARDLYSRTYAQADEAGFFIRDDWGFAIGASPDGLVGDDGGIEIKSRAPKAHLRTIVANEVPAENMAQIQTCLLVTGRSWWDYVSYCGGMPMWTNRVEPDERWFAAIVDAVEQTEIAIRDQIATYQERTAGLPETERIDHFPDMEF